VQSDPSNEFAHERASLELAEVVVPHFTIVMYIDFESHLFSNSLPDSITQKLVGAGPDYRSYYHPCFLRGKPNLCRLMNTNVNTGRLIPNPASEPDFYAISRIYPLPEAESQANNRQANQDTNAEDDAGSDHSDSD
jgi:hypothetical protein